MTVQSQSWSQSGGTIVGGYTPTPQSFQSGQPIQIPNSSQPCQHLDQSCLTFYWVTPSSPGAPWQVSYSYIYNNQTSQTVTASFNVNGPTGVQVTGPTGVPDVYQSATYGPSMGFVALLNYSIQLTAKATNPSGAQGGSFLWVQLVGPINITTREGGIYAGTGVVACVPSSFATDPSPELDNTYPYASGPTMADAPAAQGLGPMYVGDVAGEEKYAESFLTYLMWNPNLPGSIPVPLGSVGWQWACDAVNTLTPAAYNNTPWIRVCATPQTKGSAQFSPGPSWPQWQNVISNGPTEQSCHYQ
jgi:hypothetical protein